MTVWIWVCFVLLVLSLLALDLGVFNRNPHAISAKEALGWTAFWVALALGFNAVVYVMYEHHWLGIGQLHGHETTGRTAAIAFFTGYVVEKSLSLDNIFVIAMIFAYFKVPVQYQHRVLFWGILGALVMRGAMIGAGIAVIQRFTWLIYVFGGLLIVTAAKMMVTNDEMIEPEKNPMIRLFRRVYPVTTDFHDAHFFVKLNGQHMATPLALALVIVETSDLLFAVDSIPAVFAVTLDPFIVFTSNVFAILGLRSLYFALAAVLDRFHYLKSSLVFVLTFVGVKMVISHHYPISAPASLSVIVGILLVGVLASILATHVQTAHERSTRPEALAGAAEARSNAEPRGNNVRRLFVVTAGVTVLLAAIAFLIQSHLSAPIVFAALVLALVLEFFSARMFIRRLTPDVPALAGNEAPRRVSASEHDVHGRATPEPLATHPRKGEGPEPV
jgi:TerC family integral membrane protein